MLSSLAAAVLLAAAGNAAPAPGQGFADAERLEVEFSSLARHMEAALPELKRSLAGVLAAPDPDRRYRGFMMGFDGYRAESLSANALSSRHEKAVGALMAGMLSRGIFAARERRMKPRPGDAALFGCQTMGEEMKRRARELSQAGFDLEAEAARVHRTYTERGQRLRRRRALWGAAVLLPAVALLAWRLAGPGKAAAPRPPEAPAPPPFPEAVAGNFRVVGLIGRGGMGEVYEAVDTSLNRRAALKRLRPELLQDPAELENLLKEARLMAALKHPNLVTVYSIEKEAGQVYIAMEFVDGVSLQRRLDAERRLSWPEALRIARGVGAALDYAHAMKVVHRDLKPSNVMLSTKGEVKVMDFGIAYQAAKSVSRLTRAPTWGTPPYMAPEQELGGVSAAVDLYALAVCLYEMLTGELPFKGPNFLAQKREALWTPPSRLVQGLPAGVDGLFSIALAPEPSQRFKTAAALLAACGALDA